MITPSVVSSSLPFSHQMTTLLALLRYYRRSNQRAAGYRAMFNSTLNENEPTKSD